MGCSISDVAAIGGSLKITSGLCYKTRHRISSARWPVSLHEDIVDNGSRVARISTTGTL